MKMPSGVVEMEVLAFGDMETLCRPCVDCGRRTGRFCDHCLAKWRIPTEQWHSGQHTPFCSYCEELHDRCRFCRMEAERTAGPAARPTFGPEPPPGLIEALQKQERAAAAAERASASSAIPKAKAKAKGLRMDPASALNPDQACHPGVECPWCFLGARHLDPDSLRKAFMIRLTDLASNEEGGENDDKAKVSMERLMDAVIACEGIMVQQRIPFERTFCFRSPGRTGDGKSDYAGDAGKGGGKKGPVAEAESGCCREQQLAGWMKAKGEAKGAGKYKGKGEAKGTQPIRSVQLASAGAMSFKCKECGVQKPRSEANAFAPYMEGEMLCDSCLAVTEFKCVECGTQKPMSQANSCPPYMKGALVCDSCVEEDERKYYAGEWPHTKPPYYEDVRKQDAREWPQSSSTSVGQQQPGEFHKLTAHQREAAGRYFGRYAQEKKENESFDEFVERVGSICETASSVTDSLQPAARSTSDWLQPAAAASDYAGDAGKGDGKSDYYYWFVVGDYDPGKGKSEHGRKGDGKSDYAGNAGKAGGKSDYEPGKGKFEHGRTGDGKSDYAGDAGKGGAESGCCREQQLAGWMKAKGEAKGAGKYKGKGEAKGTGKDEGKSKGEPQGCGKGEVKLRVEEIGDHTKITCEKAVYKITGDSWTRL